MKSLCKQNYLPPSLLLSRSLPVQSISGLTSSFLPTVTAIRFKFLWALGCQAKEHLPKSWYPLHAVSPSLQEGESVTGWLEAKILRGAGKMGANIEAGTSGLSTPLCCASPLPSFCSHPSLVKLSFGAHLPLLDVPILPLVIKYPLRDGKESE